MDRPVYPPPPSGEETLSPATHGQACLPPPSFGARISCATPPLVRNDVKLVAHFWSAKNPIVKIFGSFLGFLPPTLPKLFESTFPCKKWNLKLATIGLQPPQLVSLKRCLDLLSCPGWPIFSGSGEETCTCSLWGGSVYFDDVKV